MESEKKRMRKMQELGLDQPVLAGSLNRVERTKENGKTTVYWLLTFKEAGKTRSVYVPKDLLKEVQSWIRNHRRIKERLAQISTLSIDIIRNHVPQKRATARGAAENRRGKRNNP